jgi:DNA-binding NarL/FixJ family response regulator
MDRVVGGMENGVVATEGTPGVRVLVVDDAPSFRESARQLLERRGYLVAGEAGCAASARRAIQELSPDAVLLDVNLPDANGFELAEELINVDPGLAILLVSATHAAESERSSAARGFVEKSQLARVDLRRFWPAP